MEKGRIQSLAMSVSQIKFETVENALSKGTKENGCIYKS